MSVTTAEHTRSLGRGAPLWFTSLELHSVCSKYTSEGGRKRRAESDVQRRPSRATRELAARPSTLAPLLGCLC